MAERRAVETHFNSDPDSDLESRGGEVDMERRKCPYSVQKRPAAKRRHIYYVKFRDETGA